MPASCLYRFSIALGVLLSALSTARAGEQLDCHIGSYRLTNGTLLDIAPSEGDTLRWRRFDGETGALHRTAHDEWKSTLGWTGRSDGRSVSFSPCAAGRVDFAGIAGKRIEFDVTDTTFTSHDTSLTGRLVMPKGDAQVPIVVLVHGSEDDSALVNYSLQRMLPAEGLGAFVYDKRGTGKSGGHYTQDFTMLADDAVSAVGEARRLAGPRLGRIGFQAGSEGGWVAPIAANRTSVDFVIVCFGLAVNVIDEDQEAVALQLSEKGYSAQDIKDAQSVASAAEAIFVSDFTSGFKEFDALRARYKSAPWYKDLRGDFTWMFLPRSEAELRAMREKYSWHTPFYYDPMPTLRADRAPQLWIMGGEDYEAPSAETRRRIESLIKAGKPYTVAYYPHAEHGITLFETTSDGARLSTRYAPGYFAMIRDFARDGRLGGKYGDAAVSTSRKGTSATESK